MVVHSFHPHKICNMRLLEIIQGRAGFWVEVNFGRTVGRQSGWQEKNWIKKRMLRFYLFPGVSRSWSILQKINIYGIAQLKKWGRVLIMYKNLYQYDTIRVKWLWYITWLCKQAKAIISRHINFLKELSALTTWEGNWWGYLFYIQT